jgi:uncharacterized protein involved in exopolysaccharide biosynthesis
MILSIAIRELFLDANPLKDYIIQDDGAGQFIAQWNLPDPQPTPAEIDAAWAVWEAGQPARDARALEIAEAQPIAKTFYASHPAVTAFIRDLTPAQREAQISAMTLTQLRIVMVYIVEAVIADIKQKYL